LSYSEEDSCTTLTINFELDVWSDSAEKRRQQASGYRQSFCDDRVRGSGFR